MQLTQEVLEKRLAMVRAQGAKAEAVVEQCRGAEMILMELFAELQMPELDEKVDVPEQASDMNGLTDE